MADRVKRLLCLALCVLALTWAAAAAGEEQETAPALPEAYADYVPVAESDTYILYLYEPQLSMVLKNKETGSLISSTLNAGTAQGKLNKTWTGYTYSGFVLDVLTGSSKNYKQADLVNTEHTLTYTYTDGGFSAEAYFPEYGIGLTVQVALDGDELLVSVPDSSIREEQPGVYLATVSLCPMFGATYMDQRTGYMLVPDGNGALIHLTDKEERFATGYSQLIYGTDAGFTERSVSGYLWGEYETVLSPHQVVAPVFGMAHTDEHTGYIAVVEQGEKRCSIEAHPNGVMRVSYNRCFAKFLLRDVYKQPLNQSGSTKMDMVETDRTHHDLAVRYCLLAGEEANYMGMAARYREYLLDNELVTPCDTGYATRVDFLGSDRESFLVSTRAVVMTSVEAVRRILADLKGEGVASILSVYRGWQNGGIYSLPVSSFSADGAIGGRGDLQALILDGIAEGYTIYPYVDALRMNATTNTFTYDAAKMVNKTTLKEKTNGQVYDTFYYLLPGKSAERLNSLVEDFRKNGIDTLALGGISDHLFSWSLRDTYYSRNDCADAYESALAPAARSLSLAMEEPFQYQWKYTRAFLNMPLDASDYMYIDEEVPFLSLTLKGVLPMYADYVNFEANKTEFLLRMAETGVYPSFYVTEENASALIYTNSNSLYSTLYDSYRSTIIEYDRALRDLSARTQGATIVNHEKLPGDVRRVTYSNGAVILVNYGGADAQVDGVTVPARSWKAGDGQ